MANIVLYEQPFLDEAFNKIEYETGRSDFQFVSFVVKKPTTDEFIANVQKVGEAVSYIWIKDSPGKAKRTMRLKIAQKLTREIGEYARSEILFENHNQFISVPIKD